MYNEYEMQCIQGLLKKHNENKLVIFGCGGHARSIVNVLCQCKVDLDIILVDEKACKDEKILGCNVKQNYKLEKNDYYIIAVGDNEKRKKMYNYLLNQNAGHCITIISSDCLIGLDVQIDTGTFIAPYAYIGPQVRIGFDSIINTGSVIEHEVVIGNHTHIAPHSTICGRSRIGNNVFCGAGSTIIDKITICDNVLIGAGAVVKENIMESGTYVGIPAKKIH